MPAERLPLRCREFSVEYHRGVSTFLRPADPGDVLADIDTGHNLTCKHDPYWAEHWPSAESLLPFLFTIEIPPEARVCEIGSGLGVLSAVLSARPCNVVSIDISASACRFAAVNIARAGGPSRVVCADWTRLPFSCRFDLLIASDILYDDGGGPAVLAAVASLVAPGGRALIADPCRASWDAFKNDAARQGFSPRVVDSHIVNDGKTRVEVVELRL